MTRRALGWILLLSPLLAAGCSVSLMATPRIYATSDADPFASVPPSLRSPYAGVLYATDRAAEEGSPESDRKYGWARDRSFAFGECGVEFGLGMSWEDLVKDSRAGVRKNPILVSVDRVSEFGRLPETTYEFDKVGGVLQVTPTARESTEFAERVFLNMVEQRLAGAPRKDIFFFVHGYANTFQDGVFVAAQVWHFLGREGVPFAYSWPAGSGGILRGYTHDRESGEFSVFHLKQVLRLLSRARGLNKIHVIAHSRGTDVFMTALRELFLEEGKKLKGDCFAGRLGVVVLAAPDIDFDVLTSRMVFEGLLLVPTRFVVYVSEGDRAIGISNWLFSSLKRLGRLQSADLPAETLERLRQFDQIEVIDARVHGFSSFGHNYFYAHPAVSSDLIRVLRDQKAAGTPERPLLRKENTFWILENDYPAPSKP